jgi:hypothetical protein
MTHPTMGLGAVAPPPRSARARARDIHADTRSADNRSVEGWGMKAKMTPKGVGRKGYNPTRRPIAPKAPPS